ncbi:hypothetical protein OG612_13765 [Streptomyces sp. NBC_01527]|uniref:hypothetical protein n=1 Tax=Streptomyces sp. NBC_01527 TaxID=2903894 RepID=UPI003870BBA5
MAGRSGSPAAIAKLAWHDRERLVLLSIRDDVLVLHSMKWQDKVRSPDELAPDPVDLDEDEITRAMELTDRMTTDDLSGCRDHDRDALEEVVQANREEEELPEPTAKEARAPVAVPLRHVGQPPRRVPGSVGRMVCGNGRS